MKVISMLTRLREIWKLFQVLEFSKDHMVIVHDYRGIESSILG